jgi:hypothetical protein
VKQFSSSLRQRYVAHKLSALVTRALRISLPVLVMLTASVTHAEIGDSPEKFIARFQGRVRVTRGVEGVDLWLHADNGHWQTTAFTINATRWKTDRSAYRVTMASCSWSFGQTKTAIKRSL